MTARLVTVAVWLAVSNFTYQWAALFREPDWLVAYERTYFQMSALFVFWVYWKIDHWRSALPGKREEAA